MTAAKRLGMRRQLAILVALVLATGLLPAAAAATPLSATQISALLAHIRTAGGDQQQRFVASVVSGTVSQNGGSPIPFTQTTDLRNGHYRAKATVGPATFQDGYDGAQWTQQNGILSIVSLPSFVADTVTQAYLSSNAFLQPAERSTITGATQETHDGRTVDVLRVQPRGGSPAELSFDARTYRLVQIVAHQASGIDTQTLSAYRAIQGVPTAMRTLDVNAAGTKTVTTVTSVKYLTAVAPAALARPAYTSQGNLTSPVSVAFQSDDEGSIGHLVVPVSLGDKQTQLVFDSGGANFLAPSSAQRLGIKSSGNMAMGGAGSKQQMSSFAAVPVVDFGGAKLQNQNFIVTALLYPLVHPKKNMTVDGLIGFEYLANYRIAIRYAEGRIDVAPFADAGPTGGVTLPFKSDGAHAYVQATVDGHTGYFLLDTGNGGGIDLNGSFVDANKLFPNGGLTYISPGGIGGTFPVTIARAKNVTLAGVSFNDVPIGIPRTKAGSFATRGVAGNLGAKILSRYTVIFDYKAQTVTFIPNDTVHAPFDVDRTGLSLNQNGPDAFEVLAVIPGSPAADAGIAANDTITAVNGTAISTGFGLGNMHPLLRGTAPFTVTIARGSTTQTVTISPRDILPAAQ